MTRGILATIYAKGEAEAVHDALTQAYAGRAVRRRPADGRGAGGAARPRLELLPDRRGRRTAAPGRVIVLSVARQPDEGRVGPGGAERQPDAGPRRDGGADAGAGLSVRGARRDEVAEERSAGSRSSSSPSRRWRWRRRWSATRCGTASTSSARPPRSASDPPAPSEMFRIGGLVEDGSLIRGEGETVRSG